MKKTPDDEKSQIMMQSTCGKLWYVKITLPLNKRDNCVPLDQRVQIFLESDFMRKKSCDDMLTGIESLFQASIRKIIAKEN